MNCGAKPMVGTRFCPGCGAPTMPLTEICVKCGARIARELAGGISPKLSLATSLLAFFLGIFGVHRFYVGKNETASVMLSFSILGLTILGLATILSLNGGWFFWGLAFVIALEIWAFVDFILAVTGHMKDNEGRLIQNWRLVVPARKPEYYYIKYTISALRVIAWVILVVGGIGSLVLGITTGGIEEWIVSVFGSIGALVWEITTGGIKGEFLPVIGMIIGIIGSFLAWLLLLAARELLQLFMDVKEDTGNTAERATITKESG